MRGRAIPVNSRPRGLMTSFFPFGVDEGKRLFCLLLALEQFYGNSRPPFLLTLLISFCGSLSLSDLSFNLICVFLFFRSLSILVAEDRHPLYLIDKIFKSHPETLQKLGSIPVVFLVVTHTPYFNHSLVRYLCCPLLQPLNICCFNQQTELNNHNDSFAGASYRQGRAFKETREEKNYR